MKKFLFPVIILLLLVGVLIYLVQRRVSIPMLTSLNNPTISSVDYRASFAIFTHGTFRVFTATMYHNLSEDVYISANNPNTVHVIKSGVTWDDFFRTLPFKLTTKCLTTGTGETFCSGQGGTLKFYLNGARDDNLLQKQIRNGDRTLITFGNENKSQIKKQIERVHLAK